MRTAIQVLIAAALLGGLSTGCDSSDPISSDPLRMIRPLRDIEMFADFDTLRLDLNENFRARAPLAIQFSASSDTEAVTVTLSANTLEVIPRDAARATITVTARADGLDPITSSFMVVSSLCAVASDNTERVYFPAAPGRTWVYDYRETERSDLHPYMYETTGSLQWEIANLANTCASVQFDVIEEFDGTKRSENVTAGTDTTVALSWTKTLTALLDGKLLIIDGYTGPSMRGLESVPWRYPAGTPDLVQKDSTVTCGFGGCVNVRVDLERDVGIVHWYFGTNQRPTTLSRTLTLRQ